VAAAADFRKQYNIAAHYAPSPAISFITPMIFSLLIEFFYA
jgi:hypothetical protein